MPFGVFTNILCEDGYKQINHLYKEKVKIYYNDNTTAYVSIAGSIQLDEPNSMRGIKCSTFNNGNCSHTKDNYIDAETGQCYYRLELHCYRLAYIDNKWKPVYRLEEDFYCCDHRDYSYDIVVDFDLLDISKEPCINVEGLIVKVIDYKKLFPNDYRYIHIYWNDDREYRVIEALEEDIKRLVDNK